MVYLVSGLLQKGVVLWVLIIKSYMKKNIKIYIKKISIFKDTIKKNIEEFTKTIEALKENVDKR